MKFKSVAEAFNFYRGKDLKELEERAKAINAEIDSNPNADIEAFNIELRGIKEAKENAELRSGNPTGLNLVTGRDYKAEEKKDFSGANVVDTPEYRSAFYKQLLGHELTANEKAAFEKMQTEQRAATINSAATSAAVLPTQTLNEVVKKARTMGGLLAECRGFNMPVKIAIPVGTPGTKAAWHTEGAAVESTTAATANVVFDGYEIIKLFSLSAKVQTMSIAAFEAYLVDELTACVMECIADAVVNGTGSNQGSGLDTITWNESNSVTVAKGGSIAYADVVNLVALLKRGYAAGAKFAMNNATLYKTFYGMLDGNKRPIFVADPKSDNVGKILGFEVVVDDNIANDVVYFGNFKYYGYNMPGGITIEVSRESSFKSGLIDYRAMAIADCKPIVAEAFTKLYIATA